MDVEDLLREAPRQAMTLRELREYVSASELKRAMGNQRIAQHGDVLQLAAVADRYGIARRLRGTLSHTSAAEHWGIDVPSDPHAHVTVDPRRSRVRAADNVKVYYRTLPDTERDAGVTGIARTVVDCARDLPIPDALIVVDSALRSRKVTRRELVAAAAQLRNQRSAHARRVIGWADPRAASVMESMLRGVLLEAGITGFAPQFPAAGRHADLGNPDTRILIEADSFLWHGSEARLIKDAERYDEFVAAGFVVLRFWWSHITHKREWLVDIVRRALASAGPPASTGATRPIGS